jgi:hypothetical protein
MGMAMKTGEFTAMATSISGRKNMKTVNKFIGQLF